LVHWPLMGGLLHLVQRRGAWAGWGPAQSPPRCTKCNSQRPVYQLHIVWCGNIIASALQRVKSAFLYTLDVFRQFSWQFTDRISHQSGGGQAQDRGSSPVKDRRTTTVTVPHNQLQICAVVPAVLQLRFASVRHLVDKERNSNRPKMTQAYPLNSQVLARRCRGRYDPQLVKHDVQ